jgi:hypothetical protein
MESPVVAVLLIREGESRYLTEEKYELELMFAAVK